MVMLVVVALVVVMVVSEVPIVVLVVVVLVLVLALVSLMVLGLLSSWFGCISEVVADGGLFSRHACFRASFRLSM